MNERGLTLVEMLVAMAIFATLSVIGTGAFTLAAQGSEQLEEASDRIGDLERFRAILRGDLYLFVDRPVIEPDTDRPRPAFMGGDILDDVIEVELGEPLLALVRSGWSNPGSEEARSELQAVTWLTTEGKLIRRTRPFLDAVRDTPYRDEVMLEGLEDVSIEFLQRGRWRTEAGRPGDDGSPVALRVSFTHPHYGEMAHVFLIGGDA